MDFISPVCRLVQGSCTLQVKKNQKTGLPEKDDHGNVIMESFIAVAIRKDDPGLGAFYQLFAAQAQADFPHLFNAQGQCTHPKFAWKIQDGDGNDTNGQSVAGKPGFAGHYIFKMTTRYAPRCYHYGKYDVSQLIQNPDEVIKKGYFVRVSGSIKGNGVKPDDRSNVPGLFVSHNMIELVAFGEEIISGPDASAVFGAAPIAGALPPGATTTPQIAAPAANGLQAPALPGALPGQTALPAIGAVATLPVVGAVAAPAALPSLPGATAALPALQAAQPQYRLTQGAAAMGVTLEGLQAQGHSLDSLVAQGYAEKIG